MPFFSGRNTIRRLAVCCVARKWGCVQNYEMLCIIFSFLKRNKDILKRENKSLFFSPKYFEYKQYTSIYLKTFVMMKAKCYFQYLAISSNVHSIVVVPDRIPLPFSKEETPIFYFQHVKNQLTQQYSIHTSIYLQYVYNMYGFLQNFSSSAFFRHLL